MVYFPKTSTDLYRITPKLGYHGQGNSKEVSIIIESDSPRPTSSHDLCYISTAPHDALSKRLHELGTRTTLVSIYIRCLRST